MDKNGSYGPQVILSHRPPSRLRRDPSATTTIIKPLQTQPSSSSLFVNPLTLVTEQSYRDPLRRRLDPSRAPSLLKWHKMVNSDFKRFYSLSLATEAAIHTVMTMTQDQRQPCPTATAAACEALYNILFNLQDGNLDEASVMTISSILRSIYSNYDHMLTLVPNQPFPTDILISLGRPFYEMIHQDEDRLDELSRALERAREEIRTNGAGTIARAKSLIEIILERYHGEFQRLILQTWSVISWLRARHRKRVMKRARLRIWFNGLRWRLYQEKASAKDDLHATRMARATSFVLELIKLFSGKKKASYIARMAEIFGEEDGRIDDGGEDWLPLDQQQQRCVMFQDQFQASNLLPWQREHMLNYLEQLQRHSLSQEERQQLLLQYLQEVQQEHLSEGQQKKVMQYVQQLQEQGMPPEQQQDLVLRYLQQFQDHRDLSQDREESQERAATRSSSQVLGSSRQGSVKFVDDKETQRRSTTSTSKEGGGLADGDSRDEDNAFASDAGTSTQQPRRSKRRNVSFGELPAALKQSISSALKDEEREGASQDGGGSGDGEGVSSSSSRQSLKVLAGDSGLQAPTLSDVAESIRRLSDDDRRVLIDMLVAMTPRGGELRKSKGGESAGDGGEAGTKVKGKKKLKKSKSKTKLSRESSGKRLDINGGDGPDDGGSNLSSPRSSVSSRSDGSLSPRGGRRRPRPGNEEEEEAQSQVTPAGPRKRRMNMMGSNPWMASSSEKSLSTNEGDSQANNDKAQDEEDEEVDDDGDGDSEDMRGETTQVSRRTTMMLEQFRDVLNRPYSPDHQMVEEPPLSIGNGMYIPGRWIGYIKTNKDGSVKLFNNRRSLTRVRILPLLTMWNIIFTLYEEKAKSDASYLAESVYRPAVSMPEFVVSFFLATYGKGKIVVRRLHSVITSLIHYVNLEDTWLLTFARFCGVCTPFIPAEGLGFFLKSVKELRPYQLRREQLPTVSLKNLSGPMPILPLDYRKGVYVLQSTCHAMDPEPTKTAGYLEAYKVVEHGGLPYIDIRVVAVKMLDIWEADAERLVNSLIILLNVPRVLFPGYVDELPGFLGVFQLAVTATTGGAPLSSLLEKDLTQLYETVLKHVYGDRSLSYEALAYAIQFNHPTIRRAIQTGFKQVQRNTWALCTIRRFARQWIKTAREQRAGRLIMRWYKRWRGRKGRHTMTGGRSSLMSLFRMVEEVDDDPEDEEN